MPSYETFSSEVCGRDQKSKRYLTQNMQDRQTQVRAGPARAAGRPRETDGMVTGRRDDAAATGHWDSSRVIQPGEELPNTAPP